MKSTETKINVSGEYHFPKLEVIYFNLDAGFCQSNPGKFTNDDLTEEEGSFFEWQY